MVQSLSQKNIAPAVSLFSILWGTISCFHLAAQDHSFAIDSVKIDKNNTLQIQYESSENAYYRLLKGSTVEIQDVVVDIQLGSTHQSQFQDRNIPRNERTFYSIEKISLSAPLDSDNDGIDDVFELQHSSILDPANPADAAYDFDLDTVSNFDEYIDGTDLSTSSHDLVTLSIEGQASALVTGANHAYLATGEFGLAIVDLTSPLSPQLSGQLKLSGNNHKVAVSESNKVAAVASLYWDNDSGSDQSMLHFVDIADPEHPALIRSIKIPVQQLLHRDGFFYASVGHPNATQIHLFDGSTLEQIFAFAPGGIVPRMHIYKSYLFASVDTPADTDVHIYHLNQKEFPLLSTLAVLGGAAYKFPLHAEKGILYVRTPEGYQTWDIQDPLTPQLIAQNNDTAPRIRSMISNGSGLALTLVGPGPERKSIIAYDIKDPTLVDQKISTLENEAIASPTDIALHRGLLLIADEESGFVVYNFQEPDLNDAAPAITLDLSHLDVDPDAEGIQVVEASRIFFEPEIVDDGQLLESTWFLNGVAIDTDTSGHTIFDSFLPLIDESGPQMDIQVTVKDTYGHVSSSNQVTLNMIPDTLGPELIFSMPGAGTIGYQTDSIELCFSDPIDLSSIDFNQITLTHTLSGEEIEVIDAFSTNAYTIVLSLEETLIFAEYQLVISETAIKDNQGNPLAHPIAFEFVNYDFDFTTAIWISDTDGGFYDPENWMHGLVPRNSQDVFICRPSADPVILIAPPARKPGEVLIQDGSVGTIFIDEPFILDGGSTGYAMFVRNKWTSTNSGILKSGYLRLLSDSTFSGPITLDGGGFLTRGKAEFLSDFNVIHGWMTLDDPETELSITGTITPGDLGITNRSGKTFEIPWITTLGETNPELYISARGAGSVLRLPNLVSLTPPPEDSPENVSMYLVAEFGGVIDLPKLQAIHPGHIEIEEIGDGSQINIPLIDFESGSD